MRQKWPLSAHLGSKLLSFWVCQSFWGCRYSISIVKNFKQFDQKWWGCRGCQHGVESLIIPDIKLMGWRRHCTYISAKGLVLVRVIHTHTYIYMHYVACADKVPFRSDKVTYTFCWYILWELLMALGHGYWDHNVVTWYSMEISFNTS